MRPRLLPHLRVVSLHLRDVLVARGRPPLDPALEREALHAAVADGRNVVGQPGSGAAAAAAGGACTRLVEDILGGEGKGGRGERTAVEDGLAHSGRLEEGVDGRESWVDGLRGEVDGARDCAALDHGWVGSMLARGCVQEVNPIGISRLLLSRFLDRDPE